MCFYATNATGYLNIIFDFFFLYFLPKNFFFNFFGFFIFSGKLSVDHNNFNHSTV